MATKTTAKGKISQNRRNENSVTELVIGIGPVNVIETPRLLTPLSFWSAVNSPQTQTPSSGTGLPFASNSQGRSIIEILSSRL